MLEKLSSDMIGAATNSPGKTGLTVTGQPHVNVLPSDCLAPSRRQRTILGEIDEHETYSRTTADGLPCPVFARRTTKYSSTRSTRLGAMSRDRPFYMQRNPNFAAENKRWARMARSFGAIVCIFRLFYLRRSPTVRLVVQTLARSRTSIHRSCWLLIMASRKSKISTASPAL